MTKSAIAAIFLFVLAQNLSAQCSDAGACVIGSAPSDDKHHHVSVEYVFGSSGGDDALTFHSVQISGSVQLFPAANLLIAMPLSSVDGPLGSSSGIGDLIVLWNQLVWEQNDTRLSLQAGGKIATAAVNQDDLPQAYQSGLGTNDVILGAAYESAHWIVALGYQLANGRSDNTIDRLERGDDLFARAGYRAHIEEIGLGLEVLAIKRLSESTVQDPDRFGEDVFISVADSDQLQVNIVGTASIPLNDDFRFTFLAGMPLLARDVNIDGLKRALAVSAGIGMTF